MPILHNINLTAEPGQRIALVGPTGAGKSSIINLLCRFYEPQGGVVSVDGNDLRSVTLESLRDQLGIVLQDSFLFSGTVRDNIRYGRLDASVDAYTEVLIQRALEHLLEGRTSFIIAHRLSTIRNADRILVIDGGEIIEAGKHGELLEMNGLYRKLYEMQLRYQEAAGQGQTASDNG